jgi:hypothetical protein
MPSNSADAARGPSSRRARRSLSGRSFACRGGTGDGRGRLPPPAPGGMRLARRSSRSHPPGTLEHWPRARLTHSQRAARKSSQADHRRLVPLTTIQPRATIAPRADTPAPRPARQSASSPRPSGMRGCQPPSAGRCITVPGKVSESRRFYVIIRGTAWSGGAVATATADAPLRPLLLGSASDGVGSSADCQQRSEHRL